MLKRGRQAQGKTGKRAPKARVPASGSTIARLRRELDEANQRLVATSEVLAVLSSSSGNLQRTFQTLLKKATQVCGAEFGMMNLIEGNTYRQVASFNTPRGYAAQLRGVPLEPHPDSVHGRMMKKPRPMQVADIRKEAAYRDGHPAVRANADKAGARTFAAVPLLKGKSLIGTIAIYRKEVHPFTDKQLAVLQNFASQAVIAIENVRLFNETTQALERQEASAEILRAIAGAPTDADQALQQIAETTARLFAAASVTILLADNDDWGRSIHVGPSATRIVDQIPKEKRQLSADNLPGNVYRENRQIHIPDLANIDPGMAHWPVMAARSAGARTVAGTPLRRSGIPIGTMIVFRDHLAPFSAEELALLQSFADQAVIAIENARLFNETREALERQTATSEVLKVIASSPSDVQPVFEAIATSANKLIGGFSTAVMRLIGDELHLAAFTPTSPEADAALQAAFPCPISRFPQFLLALDGRTTQFADTEAEDVPPATRHLAKLRGYRSMLFTPLMSSGAPIGFFGVTRKETGSFANHHVQLVRTFADQAVIANENARLFDEVQAKTRDLEESLKRQTATSEVLQVISSSQGELAPVFAKLLENATRVCGAHFGTMNLYEAGVFTRAALYNMPREAAQLRPTTVQPHPESPLGIVSRTKQAIQIEDVLTNAAYLANHASTVSVAAAGARTLFSVPMLKDGELLGAITIYRQEVLPFTDQQVELVTNFAQQAVIAIENARLINETREALERQTATADILKVIASSPANLQPVFAAIADRSNRLVGGHSTAVLRFLDDEVRLVAFTPVNPEADQALQAAFPRPLANYPLFEVAQAGQVVQLEDTEAPSELFPAGISVIRELARLRGFRSQLYIPLSTPQGPIGLISVTRKEPGTFAAHHIQLLQTFADQAVIAIENTRLFEEVQAKTRELTEALTYQTGSASILSVIASSPTDVTPVLNAIVESACEVCDSYDAIVLLKDGDDLRFSAHHGSLTVSTEKRPISRGWVAGRAYLDREPVHVRDILSDEGADFPDSREMSRRIGVRSVLSVPLLRDNDSIGAILLRRAEVNPFSDKQIALLQTFADQAVIALGNVRLFEQVREKTRDLEEALHFQTASADVLKVISQSPDKLQPVLDAIVATSRELCGSLSSTVFLLRDGRFHLTAENGRDLLDPSRVDYIRTNPIALDQPGSALARAARERRTVHVPNSSKDPEANLGGPLGVGAPSALLSVPLIREHEVIGGITLIQSVSTPFTNRQIEAIESFADQAVIAISNAGLFEQVQQRTRELSQSLDDLRSAQDRLVQTEKLASLGQLTAGIAHEIKNPLNFVNNFSSLSVELIDELTDSLRDIGVDQKKRDELAEVTQTLKGNLEKIAQHGGRADSIVRNMLLHSREGSGEQRPVDINAMVDEGLNLAYHGARAERPGFNITLQRKLDPAAGQADVYPQEVTRVLLNIISNGFYAATRRANDAGNGFEPTLSAETRNLGDRVEIRIRDNGTGMGADVKAKIFTPFFTTKPPGEGTGLGLSMSHDIIVKQHGGSLDVATEPGSFTEFIITLPRRATDKKKTGGQG